MNSKETALAGLMILLCFALYVSPIKITDLPPNVFLYCLFHPLLSQRMKNFFESSIYLSAAFKTIKLNFKYQGIIEAALAKPEFIETMAKLNNFAVGYWVFSFWYNLLTLRVAIFFFSSLLQYIGFYKRVKRLR